MKVIKKIDTAKGTHGIYPSRDGSVFYVSNRGHTQGDTSRSKPGQGSVSVIDWKTDTVVNTWDIPGGGSPDMGGVSADGTTLWLSGRYDSEVYAIDTTTGALKFRIKVPSGPHGLAVKLVLALNGQRSARSRHHRRPRPRHHRWASACARCRHWHGTTRRRPSLARPHQPSAAAALGSIGTQRNRP